MRQLINRVIIKGSAGRSDDNEARNLGVTSANGLPKRRAQINTQRLSGQSHPFMSLKILLGNFVAFFAGQILVEGHKNIIDSFSKTHSQS
jgi:hypothetical protein